MSLVNLAWENKDSIFDFLFALHAAALVIVNLTPTPKDNEALGRAYGGLEYLAGIISPKAKN